MNHTDETAQAIRTLRAEMDRLSASGSRLHTRSMLMTLLLAIGVVGIIAAIAMYSIGGPVSRFAPVASMIGSLAGFAAFAMGRG